MRPALGFLVLLLAGPGAAAEGLIERDLDLEYPEAMAYLQTAIRDAGYELQFIQPVDRGLRRRGVDAEELRVLHVLPPDTASARAAAHPDLAPLLPLRITLYRERGALRVSAMRPTLLAGPGLDPAAARILDGWESDLRRIVAAMD